MTAAGKIADWWDSQHAQAKAELDRYVDNNPGTFSVVAATLVSTCMEVGAGAVDVLRFGEGMAKGGLSGAKDDALRLLSMPVVGGGVTGKGLKLISKGANKVAAKFPKQALSSLTKCPMGQKALALGQKVKSALGKNLFGKSTQKCGKVCKGGEPINMITGEELLQLQDFQIPGPVPLAWIRTYRTSRAAIDGELGFGWSSPLDEWLELREDGFIWHDAEGRDVPLPKIDEGEHALNPVEGLRLWRTDAGFRLAVEDEPDRIFEASQPKALLLAWTNETGHAIHIRRDEQRRVTGLESTWGRSLRLIRQQHRIIGVAPESPVPFAHADAVAPWVRYEYDELGDLTRARDRADAGERYAYRNHVIAKRTLPGGFSFHFDWDEWTPRGRCRRNWGDHGIYDFHFEWLPRGISRVIDSRGGVTEYRHSTAGLLLKEASPEGRSTSYVYGPQQKPILITDGLGRATHYEYDDAGHLTAVVDAAGHRSEIENDAWGRPVRFTDALGSSWTYDYDEQGRLVQAQDPLGHATRYAYGEAGLLTRVVNPAEQARTLLWDDAARLVGEVGFDGLRLRYRYDADDRIVAVILQDKRSTTYAYDAAGRVTQITTPDGATVMLAYDAAGNLVSHTDASGATTLYRHEHGLSTPTERIDANGQVLRYEYDSERNLTGLVNARNELYRLHYDLDERLIEEHGFDGRRQRYGYDAAGQLVTHAEHLGGADDGPTAWRTAQLERDALGLLVKRTNADGAAAVYGHDPAGRLISAGNAHSQLGWAYDAAGRLTQELQNGLQILHTLDALGRRILTQVPAGHRIGYRFDPKGRLQVVSWNHQPLTQHRYDDMGQEVARQQGALESQYDYDPNGRLLGQRVRKHDDQVGAQPIISRQYGRDANGRVSTINDLRRGLTRYIYDPTDRLVDVHGAHAERFTHDPAGRLLGSTLTGPGRIEHGRLVMQGDRHLRYDAHGNLVEERSGTGGAQVQSYTYDADNRLVRAATAAGESHYQYDALGRRIGKQTPLGSMRFVYDGPRLLVEISGDTHRHHVFEPESFRPLARIDAEAGSTDDGDARVYHYQLDHRGLPQELTDPKGKVVWAGRYRTYGALALAEDAEVDNPIRLQGQYVDTETGLHYNLNRYFHPLVGTFTQQDPIGLEGGVDVYALAANPVNWADPLGLSAKDCDLAAKGAAETTTVIGRVKDLQKLGPGEKSLLDRLPNLGNPKANWQQNAGVLREEMRLGRPIRDASPLDTTGQFLKAERNLLLDRGWAFDRSTNFWMPPKP